MNIDYSKYNVDRDEPDSELALLVEQYERAQKVEEEIAADLKLAVKRTKDFEERIIPEKLAELGLGSEVTLRDGRKLKCTEQTYVGFQENCQPACKQWLKENGYGAMVKTETKERVAVSGLRPMADELPQNLFKLTTHRKVKIK